MHKRRISFTILLLPACTHIQDLVGTHTHDLVENIYSHDSSCFVIQSFTKSPLSLSDGVAWISLVLPVVRSVGRHFLRKMCDGKVARGMVRAVRANAFGSYDVVKAVI